MRRSYPEGRPLPSPTRRTFREVLRRPAKRGSASSCKRSWRLKLTRPLSVRATSARAARERRATETGTTPNGPHRTGPDRREAPESSRRGLFVIRSTETQAPTAGCRRERDGAPARWLVDPRFFRARCVRFSARTRRLRLPRSPA